MFNLKKLVFPVFCAGFFVCGSAYGMMVSVQNRIFALNLNIRRLDIQIQSDEKYFNDNKRDVASYRERLDAGKQDERDLLFKFISSGEDRNKMIKIKLEKLYYKKSEAIAERAVEENKIQ